MQSKEGRSSQQGKKKASTSGSRFERELHNLQCSINYDSNSGTRKRGESSSGNFANYGDPWCIGGDFNVVRFPIERRNSSRISFAMRRFLEVIEELLLRTYPLLEGVSPSVVA